MKKKNISPGKRENEILDFSYKKAISLANVDPIRNFFEQMGTVKRSFAFDLKKVENGVIFPASGSGVLAYAGILPKLRYKLLDYAGKIMNSNNSKELMEYELYYNMSYIWAGNWNNYKEYDEALLEKNLKIGEIWHSIIYLYHFIMVNYSMGNFGEANYYIQKCHDIGDTYDYPYAYQAYFDMKSILENKACKFRDAIITSTEAINNAKKFGFNPFIPSGNLILILFGRFKNAAFHVPFSSENPFLKISSFDFLPSF